MALYEISRPAGEAFSTRAASAVVKLVYRLVEAYDTHRTRTALMALTDAQLDDVGLQRRDIAKVGARG